MPSCSSCPIEQHLWPLSSSYIPPLCLLNLHLLFLKLLHCNSLLWPFSFLPERIAQIVLTQISPHAHLSLKASHHVSCKPKQQASGQHGRKTSLYTPSWCTWCQSCQQRLGLFSLAASPQTPELQGGPCSTHSMGTGNKLNTDETKAFERQGCCLSSAKNPGQKYNTQMLNSSLTGMSCDSLCR